MHRVKIEIEAQFYEETEGQFLLDRIADVIPEAASLKMRVGGVEWKDPLEDGDDQKAMEIEVNRQVVHM